MVLEAAKSGTCACPTPSAAAAACCEAVPLTCRVVRNAGSGLRTCSIRSNGVFGPREPHFIQRVASQAQVCVCGGILTTCFDLHVTQHVAWLQSKQTFTVLGSGRFALAAARVYAC